MKNYSILNVGSRQHVICESGPRIKYAEGKPMPDANYLGTGMALCGILREGQSLDNFKVEVQKRKDKRKISQ
jgi:hypothetical protein